MHADGNGVVPGGRHLVTTASDVLRAAEDIEKLLRLVDDSRV